LLGERGDGLTRPELFAALRKIFPQIQPQQVRDALARAGDLVEERDGRLRLRAADALIMTAAVADYRPAQSHSTKLKRGPEPMSIELLPNPDLLEEIGHARKDKKPVLIGFALETDVDEKVIQLARGKLADAGVPWDQRNRQALDSYMRVLLSSNEFVFVD